jgi:hypothetical protein
LLIHSITSPVLPPIVSVVSIDREGNDDHPARDAGAMASRGLPPLGRTDALLEVGRDRRPAKADPVPAQNFHKAERGWRFSRAGRTVTVVVALLSAVASIFAFRFS